MRLLIPVAFGLEQVVKRQLKNLGYIDTPANNGRICVDGNFDDVAKLNVFLRSGERVLLELKNFKATTFDELFDNVYSIEWEEYLTQKANILMDGKCVKSTLGAIKVSGGVIKKAILKRLADKMHVKTNNFTEDGERVIVNFSIFNDIVSISLDTSGDGLHKRGYRKLAYTAPLKETLASALIDLTYYFPDKTFCDLFCGSGTFPIVVALTALNIAPGVNRHFDFENWKFVDSSLLQNVKIEAKDKMTLDRKVEILGSDINKDAISIAKYHAKNAGVEKYITFKVADMSKFTSNVSRGIIISNPPYAERLNSTSEVKLLYQNLGKMFRSLNDWNGYFLTGFDEFERYFGKRADNVKKINNANILCGFYSYLSTKPKK